jgi:hypothetical protein
MIPKIQSDDFMLNSNVIHDPVLDTVLETNLDTDLDTVLNTDQI